MSDKEAFEDCLKGTNYRITEVSFAVLYIWRDKYGCEVCFDDGFLYVRYNFDNKYKYTFPIGKGDFRRALSGLEEHFAERGEELRLDLLCDEMREKLEEEFPGRFLFEELRDSADYIYRAESLSTLAGKKLHSKRNFINRFKLENEGRWSFDDIRAEDIGELNEYEKHWRRDNRTSEGDLDAENRAIKELLSNMDRLGAFGGILRLDGRIIGFSVGSRLTGDTADVHIEKAEWMIPGAYQTLNNEFIKRFCGEYEYINREDDMGIEGLRKAKLSYYPDEIKMKYSAVSKCAQYLVMESGYHAVSKCKRG
jgi:hypothetical protein